jgi:hypothetical protein
MFEEEQSYEYNYDSILEDADELYDYEDDYDYNQEIEYENYYHSITEEIADD